MPAQQAAQAPRNNQPERGGGPPDAQNPRGNDGNRGVEPLPENATLEQAREYITNLQLTSSNQKRQLDEVTRERDQLLTNQRNKRRRTRAVEESTPDDPKYTKAGKRCMLMHQLWVESSLFETELDPTYTNDRRYEQGEPNMQIQGNLLDVLDAALALRENLFQKVHFQNVFMRALNEQRRNSATRARKTCGSLIFGCNQKELNRSESRQDNEEFQRLLGYRPDRPADKRYRALPPLFYSNEATGSNERVFRHPILLRLFRACAFGPSSVSDAQAAPANTRGQPTLRKILGLKAITPGAIAFSAVLAHWCLTPDDEFSEKGSQTGIKYKENYDYYKKLINEGLRVERGRLEHGAIQGPFTRLMNDWE
ncbi:hypothetical protein FRC08_016108 [Ceratobasidium sp. 394]|nr:hypothetical protein FRC08_016108 [Ceratobasidium sp. 394]